MIEARFKAAQVSAVALVVFGWASIAHAQQRATGLVYTDVSRYQSIPLAALPSLGRLQEEVDLSPSFPTPGDQGLTQGSCVGWALGYALKSYQEHVERRWDLNSTFNRFSPSFIYNQVNRSGNCSAGITIVDALNLVRSRGIARLSDFPYDKDNCIALPTQFVLQNSREFAIADWRRVNIQDETEIKTHLSSGFPVLIGMDVDDGFQNLGRDEIYNQSRRGGRALGPHAMVIVGYSDRRGAFKVINSWGTNWSSSGFGWIAYSTLSALAREGYVAQDIVAQAPPAPAPQPFPQPQPNDQYAVVVATVNPPQVFLESRVPAPRGQDGGLRFLVSGLVSRRLGQYFHIEIVLLDENGNIIPAGFRDSFYRHPTGALFTKSLNLQISQDMQNFRDIELFMPNAVVNVPRDGRQTTFHLAAVANLWVDDKFITRSQPMRFEFRR